MWVDGENVYACSNDELGLSTIRSDDQLATSSEMVAVVLRWVVVLGVEGHRIGRRPMHHGRRRRCSTVHHVTHTATVGTVSSARSSRIQSHCIERETINE